MKVSFLSVTTLALAGALFTNVTTNNQTRPQCTDPNNGRTSDGTSCIDQKNWGNCDADWMVGWCCATCFDCADGCGAGGGGGGNLYCPNQNDFTSGGNVEWKGNGWRMTGPGGVHGKQTFNLNGGYVEFTMDTSGAHGGINNNLYTSSPDPSYFPAYCDIQPNGSPQCMEMDIIENNGNCMAQSTWHTWPNRNGGCDESGCAGKAPIGGVFDVKASFSTDGWMSVVIKGQNIDFSPYPSDSAKSYVQKIMNDFGGQIHSTQWQGWVPSGNCGSGDLRSSVFEVSNLRIMGTIVQGPEATRC